VTPPAVIDAREAPGNVVSIDIGDGRFVSYAHLANGSLLVRSGDVVREGQALGLIGNSGNSLGPHLHFQVGDAAEVLISEGLPFAMRNFDLVGLAQPGALLSGQPWTTSPQRPSRAVKAEMPLENMVVRFASP
jgi:murein DD-endopeptidase MepM/ murein hydrolase activator NlpD